MNESATPELLSRTGRFAQFLAYDQQYASDVATLAAGAASTRLPL